LSLPVRTVRLLHSLSPREL